MVPQKLQFRMFSSQVEIIYKGRLFPYLTKGINYTRKCFCNLNSSPYILLYLTGVLHDHDVGDRKKKVLAFNYSNKQSNVFNEKHILERNIKCIFLFKTKCIYFFHESCAHCNLDLHQSIYHISMRVSLPYLWGLINFDDNVLTVIKQKSFAIIK